MRILGYGASLFLTVFGASIVFMGFSRIHTASGLMVFMLGAMLYGVLSSDAR